MALDKNYKILLLVFCGVLLTGCLSMRSAQGLSEGELNLNYIAPLSASLRYGITDNIEARVTNIFISDIFIHTNSPANRIDYGIVLGTSYYGEDKFRYVYSGGVFSIRANETFSPYLSTIIMMDRRVSSIDLDNSHIAVGSDIRLPISSNWTFLLTPEIGSRFHSERNDFYDGSAFVDMNIGIIYNFK